MVSSNIDDADDTMPLWLGYKIISLLEKIIVVVAVVVIGIINITGFLLVAV